ncbi:MAG: hypothetical protein ACXVPQ_04150 [Bacteroidia bacterium]
MKLKLLLSGFVVFGILYLTNTSCAKKTDCIANIFVNDSNGVAVNGADVRLFANVKTPQGGTVTADLKANGLTDGEGKVSFTFKLPAIYDVRAAVSTRTAASIIKLEEGKAVDKTVTIR